jgi:hypothetical protein
MNTIGSHIKAIGHPMHMPCRSISSGITRAKNLEWLYYKQYVDANGKDEADAFIKAGTVMVREQRIGNARVFQFCNESEYLRMTFVKKTKMCAQQQKAIKTNAFKQLQMSISKGNAGADFSGDEGDPDDPDDRPDLPKTLLALMGKCRGRPAGRASNAKASRVSADDKVAAIMKKEAIMKEAIMKKAHKMHSLLLSVAPKSSTHFKKIIQKEASDLSKLIMDDSSKGMKCLLVQIASILEKAGVLVPTRW